MLTESLVSSHFDLSGFAESSYRFQKIALKISGVIFQVKPVVKHISVLLEGDVYAVFDVKPEINETSISK